MIYTTGLPLFSLCARSRLRWRTPITVFSNLSITIVGIRQPTTSEALLERKEAILLAFANATAWPQVLTFHLKQIVYLLTKDMAMNTSYLGGTATGTRVSLDI